MLNASAEKIAADLRDYGENATADWILACTDDELLRVCSVSNWLAFHGPGTPSGSSVLLAKALALAAVYVRAGAPRELARSRRWRLGRWRSPAGRRPDLMAQLQVGEDYGVGQDARDYWEP